MLWKLSIEVSTALHSGTVPYQAESCHAGLHRTVPYFALKYTALTHDLLFQQEIEVSAASRYLAVMCCSMLCGTVHSDTVP